MAKAKKLFVCDNCGFEVSKWQGQCPDCQSWNTFQEQVVAETSVKGKAVFSDNAPPQRLKDVKNSTFERYSTGISEFDRVLGGGIVKDSLVILSGEPGSGKSSLFCTTSNNVANLGKKVLYVSGEESEGQVKSRSVRILGNDISDNVWIKSETSLNKIKIYIKEIDPDLIIIDSIQTLYLEEELPSRSGGAVQIIACIDELMAIAKRDKRAIFIVGHVTKEGELGGVKRLEHMVDTVLYLDGDRGQQLRVLSAIKNRYGEIENGIFTMEENGLIPIDNPFEYFLTKRDEPAIGCALTVSMEGSRPIVVEIESLVDKCAFGNPMRVAEGVNRQQLQVLSAILEKRAGLQLGYKDIYVKVTGGLKIQEPSVNLGILMSIASSYADKPLSDKALYIGEVGLTGELKSVAQINRRLKEVAKLGFTKAYIPKGNYKGDMQIEQLEIIEVANIREVIERSIGK